MQTEVVSGTDWSFIMHNRVHLLLISIYSKGFALISEMKQRTLDMPFMIDHISRAVKRDRVVGSKLYSMWIVWIHEITKCSYWASVCVVRVHEIAHWTPDCSNLSVSNIMKNGLCMKITYREPETILPDRNLHFIIGILHFSSYVCMFSNHETWEIRERIVPAVMLYFTQATASTRRWPVFVCMRRILQRNNWTWCIFRIFFIVQLNIWQIPLSKTNLLYHFPIPLKNMSEIFILVVRLIYSDLVCVRLNCDPPYTDKFVLAYCKVYSTVHYSAVCQQLCSWEILWK